MGKHKVEKKTCRRCGRTYPQGYQGMLDGKCERCRMVERKEKERTQENADVEWGKYRLVTACNRAER